MRVRVRVRRACILPGLLTFFVLAAPAAARASVQVSAKVDARRIGLDDQLQYTLTIEGPSIELSEDPRLPSLENLEAAGGPFVSTQVSIVNGRFQQGRSYTYVLRPRAVGAASIGAATVKLTSGDQQTRPIRVDVVAGSVRRPARRRRADPFVDRDQDPFEAVFGRRGRRAADPKIFVEATMNRRSLYVGEPLLLTYHIYTQVRMTDLQLKSSPQYPGFWSEELKLDESRSRVKVVTVKGERYERHTILQKLLFPTRQGPLGVPAVKFGIRTAPRSFFGRGADIERSTRDLAVEVKPLPTDPDFSGAVGRFRVAASLDKSELPFGEAATLRFEVTGNGNLKWIEQGPKLEIEGAKIYPPQTKSRLKVRPDGISGSKTWDYVVVPETSGPIAIPPMTFSYFDPKAGRLVRARTDPLNLKVAGALTGAGLPALQRRIRLPLGGTGLSLRGDLDVARGGWPALSARQLGWASLLVLALHGALLGGTRLLGDLRFGRGQIAPRRSVRGALADLRRARNGNMSKEASAALIEKSLHDVFGAPRDGTSAVSKGERERAAQEVLEEVHFIRYAPQLGDYSEKIVEVATRAEQVVRKWA